MAVKKYTEDMLWPEWTDVLGNTYKPGDIVAIAIINGRSPQMVLAKVDRINRVNSYGEPHMVNKVFELAEPIRHDRECYIKEQLRSRNNFYYSSSSYYRDHVCDNTCTEYWERTETKKVPSCTVTATPIMDARGFHRTTDHDGKTKAVTYSIPENIILVQKGEGV